MKRYNRRSLQQHDRRKKFNPAQPKVWPIRRYGKQRTGDLSRRVPPRENPSAQGFVVR